MIAKLTEEAYINDNEYALAYVRTQSNVSLKGPQRITRELQEKKELALLSLSIVYMNIRRISK
ncbi:hypothetical protein GCM10020331_089270 [Ectobacillus funiculus]